MNATIRKVRALAGKDFADLIKNPTMFVVCLMPIGFMVLYRFVIGDAATSAGVTMGELAAASEEIATFMLGSSLCMTIGMVASMIVLYGIAEEKEKHTLRTLMLANVRASEVVISKSSVALLAVTVVNAACFFVAEGQLSWLAPYLVLGLVGALPVVFVSLVLGLACRDQMTAGFYSVPVLLVALVPIFGMLGEGAARIASFSPLGGIYELMGLAIEGALFTEAAVVPLLVTMAWIAAGALMFAALFRRLARDN